MGRYDEHDRINAETGFRFVRALAVERAALDRSLHPSDVRILAAISYHMNSAVKRAYPGYDAIADVADVKPGTIKKAIARLEAAGYIFRERRAPPTGGRALVHYGLKGILPSDIDAMVANAVEKIRTQKAGSDRVSTCPVSDDLTGYQCTPSEADRASQNPVKGSDGAFSCAQEPSVGWKDSLVSADALANKFFSDDQIDDLHHLHATWGATTAESLEVVDRASFVRLLTNEIAAARMEHADEVLQPALLHTLNTMLTTKAKNPGGGTMLRFLRTVLRSRVAEVLAGRAKIITTAVTEQAVAEQRHRDRLAPRSARTSTPQRKSWDDIEAGMSGVDEEAAR